jgi:hypothetical protein
VRPGSALAYLVTTSEQTAKGGSVGYFARGDVCLSGTPGRPKSKPDDDAVDTITAGAPAA